MPNPKSDFQTEINHYLHPILQQQESLQLQNSHQRKQMNGLQNSFIEANNSFQTENQNINFSDHTPFSNLKQFHFTQTQFTSGNIRPFNYNKQNTRLQMPKQIQALQLQKTQKLYQEQSSNKSYFPVEENSSITDQLSESFNENNLGGLSRRGFRKRILPENMKLSHKDHMLLGGKVISGLEKNIVSLPFREPVDVQRYNIHDYLEIIKQPMDLRTIKRKIFNEQYDHVDQIYSDIELIISNSMKYNELNPDFVRLTRNFQKSYHKIRRDCERNMRKFKIEEQKKAEATATIEKTMKKTFRQIQNRFPTNDVEIMSSFDLKELSKLAKKIKKLQAQQQIQLFKKIGIFDTMIIDIKNLSTKQVRGLMKEVERIQKSKEEFIRNEEKKENSHLTTCDNEYRQKA